MRLELLLARPRLDAILRVFTRPQDQMASAQYPRVWQPPPSVIVGIGSIFCPPATVRSMSLVRTTRVSLFSLSLANPDALFIFFIHHPLVACILRVNADLARPSTVAAHSCTPCAALKCFGGACSARHTSTSADADRSTSPIRPRGGQRDVNATGAGPGTYTARRLRPLPWTRLQE